MGQIAKQLGEIRFFPRQALNLETPDECGNLLVLVILLHFLLNFKFDGSATRVDYVGDVLRVLIFALRLALPTRFHYFTILIVLSVILRSSVDVALDIVEQSL